MSVEGAVETWLGHRPVGRGARIVVAVSGGADSVALSLALGEAAARPSVPVRDAVLLAHFNHRLRSEAEHAGDLDVVRAVAARTGLPLVTGSAGAGEIARRAGAEGGLEASARVARNTFLVWVCRLCGAHVLCTAHTADDQAETVLMRMLSGIEGTLLAGIPPEREIDAGLVVSRPLLETTRSEIEAYLGRRGQRWSQDRTNANQEYRRNLVRHVVLPQVERRWPSVRGDLLRLSCAMRGYKAEVVSQARTVAVELRDDTVTIDRESFFQLGRDARLQLLYGALAKHGLLRHDDRPSHRFFEPALDADPGGERVLINARGIRVGLEERRLTISPDIVRHRESGYLRAVVEGCPVELGAGTFMRMTTVPDAAERVVVQLDNISWPVVVRPLRPGDRMSRAGTRRLVSSVLTSAGIPRSHQQRIPLVVDRCGVVAALGELSGHANIVRDDPGTGGNGYALVMRSQIE